MSESEELEELVRTSWETFKASEHGTKEETACWKDYIASVELYADHHDISWMNANGTLIKKLGLQ